MTDPKELSRRLRERGTNPQLGHDYLWHEPSDALSMEAASVIDTLVHERDERARWAKEWHHTIETLATIHGLGILDRDEIIPAFGKYVDGLKDRAHSSASLIDAQAARIAELEKAVEQAYRDGLTYASLVETKDQDLAWEQSRARKALSNE